ncbi:ankyrin protein [Fusarium tjaetaba]|uniref:Ankyrin protein n=1 Tax=Fusarium tjaetaba TaxID=1567544 RepID=A0A8H5VID8_9HYPO|nr:ankyrin protein [Fusarium tjaetaba]KAF5622159.1 ankyrin protein [Fusarium tjaetaba]
MPGMTSCISSKPAFQKQVVEVIVKAVDGITRVDGCNLPELEDLLSYREGLVIVDEKRNIISLVHYTTQEHLDQVRHKWLPNSHKEVALSSLAYLPYDDFAEGTGQSDSVFEHRLHKYILLYYCAKNWADHVPDALDEEVDEAAFEFLEDDQRVAHEVQVRMVTGYHFQRYNAKAPIKIGAVHISAQFGLTKIVSQLLDGGAEANVKDDLGSTPLSYAAEYGHKEAVELLMKHTDTDTDSADEQGRTTLSWAAGADMSMYSVNANSKDDNGQIPISWAACEGHRDVVGFFMTLDDVQIHSADRRGNTALKWAARNGYGDIVLALEAKSQRGGAARRISLLDTESDTAMENIGDTPASHVHETARRSVVGCSSNDWDSYTDSGLWKSF